MLEGYFRLKEHGTTVGAEVLAGLTTFMVMAYIIFVNPAILSFMPFSYSITNEIGAGFVSYVLIKVVRGRARAIHPLMYAAAAAFVLYFVLH
jgi:xanthine/uracil/vitamin C permease (AzgA family)